ncbi:MAG: DNA/RNA non-specific endonuclease [Prevotella histicola]|nr:DNA/RNA non-specific endonuclease [Prevotella histicola]
MKIRISVFTTLFVSFIASIMFISCNENDTDNGTYGQQNGLANNTNSNILIPNYDTHRLEFPKTKGGKSIIITHKLKNGEVNYGVEWDAELKSNRWTCYELYSSNRKGGASRWKAKDGELQYPFDPLLPMDSYFVSDHFWGSGYDHGHLCPSADRLNTDEANKQTFYISNMQPQLSKFNGSDKRGGIWLTMENKMRSYITNGTTDTLFICRGGTIDSPALIKEYRRDRFIIPGYFFSAALLKYKVKGQGDWQYKAIGFWFKHENNQKQSLKPYVVSIAKLEQLTGIDFFCNLPDNIEKNVENKTPEQLELIWNIQ